MWYLRGFPTRNRSADPSPTRAFFSKHPGTHAPESRVVFGGRELCFGGSATPSLGVSESGWTRTLPPPATPGPGSCRLPSHPVRA